MARRHGMRRRESAGFTLIELLIVVAIIGIIAAIAMPNLLNAVDKSKQKKSMSDIRTIGTAVEAYATDTAKYPANISDWNSLKGVINPYFIKNPPDGDGWSNLWDVSTAADGSIYTLSSFGKDAILSPRTGGMTDQFDCDIVYSTGQFFQWPQGTQT